MKIEQAKIDSIRPYDRNPRRNDQAVEAVARSITEFGFRQPIVVDRERVIVVGHTRYKAALKLGLKAVPVHVADLTPDQARAYRIADNQTGNLAEWAEADLSAELAALADAEVDLSVLGFGDQELNELLHAPSLQDGIMGDDGGEPDGADNEELADTAFTFGQYRFPVDREVYLRWREQIRSQVGFDTPSCNAEIKRRMGL